MPFASRAALILSTVLLFGLLYSTSDSHRLMVEADTLEDLASSFTDRRSKALAAFTWSEEMQSELDIMELFILFGVMSDALNCLLEQLEGAYAPSTLRGYRNDYG